LLEFQFLLITRPASRRREKIKYASHGKEDFNYLLRIRRYGACVNVLNFRESKEARKEIVALIMANDEGKHLRYISEVGVRN